MTSLELAEQFEEIIEELDDKTLDRIAFEIEAVLKDRAYRFLENDENK